MQKSISSQAKSLANKAGVKTCVRTYHGSLRVTFLSEPSDALVDQIKALSTSEAHGDIQNDTRYYTGMAVYVSFQYEISPISLMQYDALKNSYNEHGYHFRQAVISQLGYRGQAILDKGL